MSKTIRNQKTKGFLDKLALQQRTRKLIRAVKNECGSISTNNM